MRMRRAWRLQPRGSRQRAATAVGAKRRPFGLVRRPWDGWRGSGGQVRIFGGCDRPGSSPLGPAELGMASIGRHDGVYRIVLIVRLHTAPSSASTQRSQRARDRRAGKKLMGEASYPILRRHGIEIRQQTGFATASAGQHLRLMQRLNMRGRPDLQDDVLRNDDIRAVATGHLFRPAQAGLTNRFRQLRAERRCTLVANTNESPGWPGLGACAASVSATSGPLRPLR